MTATKLLIFRRSRGAPVPIRVTEHAFDPWREIDAHQARTPKLRGRSGATAVFVGTMRDFNDGDENIESMTLEHYAGMTDRHLEAICADAQKRWPIQDPLVLHRIGELRPGDPIVLIAVWSAHRAAAFDACRFIIEDLKAKAPFWKKEALADGSRWVSQNTPATDIKSDV